MWQFKTAVFLHWYQISAVLLPLPAKSENMCWKIACVNTSLVTHLRDFVKSFQGKDIYHLQRKGNLEPFWAILWCHDTQEKGILYNDSHQNSILQNDTQPNDIVQNDTKQNVIEQDGIVQNDTKQNVTEQDDIVQNDIMQNDTHQNDIM
jgi:hypothetical protein